MGNKGTSSLVIAGILLIIGIVCFVKTLHVNDVQNLQVIQDLNGKMIFSFLLEH